MTRTVEALLAPGYTPLQPFLVESHIAIRQHVTRMMNPVTAGVAHVTGPRKALPTLLTPRPRQPVASRKHFRQRDRQPSTDRVLAG